MKAGTPSARLDAIIIELAKRYPDAYNPFSSRPQEVELIKALDAHVAKLEHDLHIARSSAELLKGAVS